jgi:hypothetical protein
LAIFYYDNHHLIASHCLLLLVFSLLYLICLFTLLTNCLESLYNIYIVIKTHRKMNLIMRKEVAIFICVLLASVTSFSGPRSATRVTSKNAMTMRWGLEVRFFSCLSFSFSLSLSLSLSISHSCINSILNTDNYINQIYYVTYSHYSVTSLSTW